MLTNYFKARRPFVFSPHPYELGNVLGLKQGYEDNHFLLKIYNMEESSFQDYYRYHMEYYLSKYATSEREFFSHVWHIVSDRIDYFKQGPELAAHGMQNPICQPVYHISVYHCTVKDTGPGITHNPWLLFLLLKRLFAPYRYTFV